jgi:hypothetical protein
MTLRKLTPFAAAIGLIALPGCMDREVAAIEPQQIVEQIDSVDVFVNRDIDILFVIDNSNSMADEQDSLATNFDRFINVLNTIDGGLPNVHIGVVSTDVGAGPYGISRCNGNGDNGLLLDGGGNCSLSDNWIENVGLEDGSRQTNYTNTLSETFACIARVGDQGCGFEQPLEAMRRALNGSNAQNDGFLRPDAKLAVILISDEDDCSAEDVSLFDTSDALDTADSALGFLESFRCFEFGVQCDPDTPRSLGLRQDCVARTDSPYLHDVSEYVNFLRSLKNNPGDILVAGIIGNPTDVEVDLKDGKPHLKASCESASGEAAPGIRLQTFLESFPNRNTTTTICDSDLSDALTRIANDFAEVFGDSCLDGDVRLTDGEPTCTVADVLRRHQDNEVETVIAKCDASRSNTPCYYYELNEAQCNAQSQPTHLELLVERGDTEPPNGTEVVAHCEVN